MKNTITEMNSVLQGISITVDETEHQIRDLEDKKKIPNQNNTSVRSLWVNYKHSKIHIMKVPEGGGESKKFKTYLKK